MRLRGLVVLLSTVALEAHTSEYNETMSLEQLVRQSDAIVVVTPAAPATEKHEEPIVAAEKQSPAFPPFVRVTHRYLVREVLKTSEPLKPKQTLLVEVADVSTRREVHRRYHLEGVRKIPIYRSYQPRGTPDGGTGASIVFLNRSGGEWEFTASGALEPETMRAEITTLLAQ